MTGYNVSINDDPIAESATKGATTVEGAAKMAARYGEIGEVITIIGPRGGLSRWEIVGTGILRTAHPIALKAAA